MQLEPNTTEIHADLPIIHVTEMAMKKPSGTVTKNLQPIPENKPSENEASSRQKNERRKRWKTGDIKKHVEKTYHPYTENPKNAWLVIKTLLKGLMYKKIISSPRLHGLLNETWF